MLVYCGFVSVIFFKLSCLQYFANILCCIILHVSSTVSHVYYTTLKLLLLFYNTIRYHKKIRIRKNTLQLLAESKNIKITMGAPALLV